MPLIHCETNRIALNEFELVHSWFVGADSRGETVTIYKDANNDRLKASLYCIGYAARKLSEVDTKVRVVRIASDMDGKDFRFGKEMDIAFALIAPVDDFQARKDRSLYRDYGAIVGRIVTLKQKFNIEFELR